MIGRRGGTVVVACPVVDEDPKPSLHLYFELKFRECRHTANIPLLSRRTLQIVKTDNDLRRNNGH